MSQKIIKNPAASRISKLKTAAKEQGLPFTRATDLYILNGVLRRIAASEFSEKLTLKGGMMMLSGDGRSVRPTRDIDLHNVDCWTPEEVKPRFRAILETPIEDNDGLVFDLDKLKVTPDWTDDQIGGTKIAFVARLQQSKMDVSIDLGSRNPIYPHRLQASIPGLLAEQPPVEMQMYPFETSIAEKMRATIHHGMNVSRMKDLFDLSHFAATREFDGSVLAEAARQSCEAFKTEIPTFDKIPAWQTENVGHFSSAWAGFCRKPGFTLTLDQCVDDIQRFMKPVVDHINGGEDPGYWRPGEGWGERLENTRTLG